MKLEFGNPKHIELAQFSMALVGVIRIEKVKHDCACKYCETQLELCENCKHKEMDLFTSQTAFGVFRCGKCGAKGAFSETFSKYRNLEREILNQPEK